MSAAVTLNEFEAGNKRTGGRLKVQEGIESLTIAKSEEA